MFVTMDSREFTRSSKVEELVFSGAGRGTAGGAPSPSRVHVMKVGNEMDSQSGFATKMRKPSKTDSREVPRWPKAYATISIKSTDGVNPRCRSSLVQVILAGPSV